MESGSAGSLVILVLCLVSRTTIGESCSQSAVVGCLTDLVDYANSLPNHDAPIKWYDEYQFTHICRLYDEIKQCLSPFKQYCETAERLLFQGIDAEYQYMCDDVGWAVIKGYKECFLDEDLGTNIQELNARFKVEASNLETSMQSARTRQDLNRMEKDFCDLVNKFFHSLTDEFYQVELCQDEAINYVLTINKKVLVPLLHSLSCEVKEQCTASRLQRCHDKLVPVSSTFDRDSSDVVTVLTGLGGKLTAICQANGDYKTCALPFEHVCSASQVQHLGGLAETVKYVCEAGGKSAYLANVDCLNNTVVAETQVCKSQGLAKLENAASNEDYCSVVKEDLIGCVQNVLLTYCGKDMASYQYKVDSRMWKPTLSGKHCAIDVDGGTGSATSAKAMNSVYMGLLLLLAVFCRQM